MRNNLLIIVIFLSFTCSGCAAILVGAVAVGGYKLVKKGLSGPSKLTEAEREQTECRNISTTKDKIFETITKIFEGNDFFIQSSNYDDGEIIASSEELSWKITALIEEPEGSEVMLRIIVKDNDGIVENKRVYDGLFADIQEDLAKGDDTIIVQ